MKTFFTLASMMWLSACAGVSAPPAAMQDDVISLSAANGRKVDVRVIMPARCDASCPLVIFSHGANATYNRYDALLLEFAQAGMRVAAPNHVDSEAHPNRAQYGPADWLPSRVEDYQVIARHFSAAQTVAAGHSFGALIAQLAGGAQMVSGDPAVQVTPDLRPLAVLAFSPPGPIPGYVNVDGWAQVSVPLLVTTGTSDIVPQMADEWELHLASYEAAPASLGYAIVYDDMDHYMNGAYGRQTDADTPERRAAMEHLARTSISFAQAVLAGAALTHDQWSTNQQPFAAMKSNHLDEVSP